MFQLARKGTAGVVSAAEASGDGDRQAKTNRLCKVRPSHTVGSPLLSLADLLYKRSDPYCCTRRPCSAQVDVKPSFARGS